MTEVTELSAVALRDAIAAGDVSAVDAAEGYLAAIESRDPAVGAYNEVLAEQALAQARAVAAKRAAGESLGPLAGVPVALKDNMCTSWGKTTCSSKILADFHAPYNAGVTDRIRT